MYKVRNSFLKRALPVLLCIALVTSVFMMFSLSANAAASEWATGTYYAKGDIVTYLSKAYECVIIHTAQAGWEPDKPSALWKAYDGPITINTPTSTQTPTSPLSTGIPVGVYKISGFLQTNVANAPSSGFTIESLGTGKSTTADSNGYFELSIPVTGIDQHAVKISKAGYLARTISHLTAYDMKIGSSAKPVEMWAGDINQDSVINMADIMELSKHFNTAAGDANYNADVDFNKDNAINLNDVMTAVKEFNKTTADYPAPEIVISTPVPPSNTPTPTQTSTPTPSSVNKTASASIYVPSSNEKGTWICLDGSNSKGMNPMGGTGDISGIKSYNWDFGDGSAIDTGEYLNTVTHSYSTTGTYTARLTVTDYNNSTASTSVAVNVVASLPKVSPSEFTSTAINNAISSLNGSPGIVNLPAGTYTVVSTINVPANVVLQGVGNTTVLNSTANTAISVTGNNVKITNLKLKGPGETTTGISVSGRKNVIIDHCEISNYSIANSIGTYSSVTYEFNTIHDNTTSGLGYGIMVVSESYAMIRKNTFYNNRHSVAGGGSGSQTGWKTSYDICQNTISQATNSTADVTVDAHAGTQGRIRIANNTFSGHKYSIGLRDGWGEIKGNTFTNISQYICKFDIPLYSDGNIIPNAGCHDFNITGNTITNCSVYWRILYGTGNIVLNGRNIDGMVPYTGTGIW